MSADNKVAAIRVEQAVGSNKESESSTKTGQGAEKKELSVDGIKIAVGVGVGACTMGFSLVNEAVQNLQGINTGHLSTDSALGLGILVARGIFSGAATWLLLEGFHRIGKDLVSRIAPTREDVPQEEAKPALTQK